jgi:hypothetical protein
LGKSIGCWIFLIFFEPLQDLVFFMDEAVRHKGSSSVSERLSLQQFINSEQIFRIECGKGGFYS